MAGNGVNQGNVRDRLVNGIQPDGGERDEVFPGLPDNEPAQTTRPSRRRQDGKDGRDLVSGRKFQGEQRG